MFKVNFSFLHLRGAGGRFVPGKMIAKLPAIAHLARNKSGPDASYR
jgi:hypothetical protein